MNTNHSWDARAYDKVSINVQLEWGQKLLEKKQWIGNEIVMDAGAGSGNLTKILADKVPNGKVYAVDADPIWFSRQSPICQITKMCRSSVQAWTKCIFQLRLM